MTTVVTNSLFLRKVFKTLLSRNIKFLGNVYFGMVVRGSAERVFFVILYFLE